MTDIDLTASANSPVAVQLGVGATDILAAPAALKLNVVKCIIVVNESGSPVTYDLWVGTGAAATHRIVPTGKSLPAYAFDVWDLNLNIGGSAKLRGLASIAAVVTVTVSYYVIA